MPDASDDLKELLKLMWEAGDFGQVARYGERAAEELVAGLPIPAGARVLDVACGTGNMAIPAARRGAHVTGVDIAANLLEQARRRAAADCLDARFEHGDAEQLPFADGEFDMVLGIFGAMFAPHPDRVAAELIRVCRPGGTILMANWTPEGFFGDMFAIGQRYMPPPEEMAPPPLWGDEATVRRRLGPGTSSLRTTRRIFPLEYPFAPADVVQLYRRYFGPTVLAVSILHDDEQAAYTRDLEALWRRHNRAAGEHTLVPAEYLEVVATRR